MYLPEIFTDNDDEINGNVFLRLVSSISFNLLDYLKFIDLFKLIMLDVPEEHIFPALFDFVWCLSMTQGSLQL